MCYELAHNEDLGILSPTPLAAATERVELMNINLKVAQRVAMLTYRVDKQNQPLCVPQLDES